MNWKERLHWFLRQRRQWLGQTRRRGWGGLSILVFRQDTADHPTRIRINYYVLLFLGLLLVAIPVAGFVLFLQRSLTAAGSTFVIENRVSLLQTMRLLVQEKEELLIRASQHIGEFEDLSQARAPVLFRIRSDERWSAGGAGDAPSADRLNYDLNRLVFLNRQAQRVLGTDAFHALESSWTRMTIHNLMPRGRPLPAGIGTLTSVYGGRPNPFGISDTGPTEKHSGIDFAAAPGTPIVATAPGVVIRAMTTIDQGYGKHVRIHHGLGYTTLYAHCNDLAVTQGEFVRRGQVIGFLGRTGRATGNHVHYEVAFGSDPSVDPQEYVQLR